MTELLHTHHQDKKNDIFYGNDLLILGIGNYLMGDEGVGVHFIKTLNHNEFPAKTTIIDGGTGGFLLVPYLENHPVAILVDATIDGQKPGTVSLLRPKYSNDFPTLLSGHNFGLKDMVEVLTLFDRMPDLYLFTISIESMNPMCTELSPEVQAAIPIVKHRVLTLIKELKNSAAK